jgi:Uma2 family endonuclease
MMTLRPICVTLPLMSHGLALPDDRPVSTAEFERFLDAQRDHERWELVDGRIYMMTNPDGRHELIVGNLGGPLHAALRKRGCQASQGGMRVQRSDDERGTYSPKPDIVGWCSRNDAQRYTTEPMVVVEVLSPGTEDHDRERKLPFYKALPTLRHIVFIHKTEMRVEHWRRSPDGWSKEILPTDAKVLRLEAALFEIDLETIYEGVVFGSD